MAEINSKRHGNQKSGGLPAFVVRNYGDRPIKGSMLMPCPKCNAGTVVINVRRNVAARAGKRRRCCVNCAHRFTTYERTEDYVFGVKIARIEALLDEIKELSEGLSADG